MPVYLRALELDDMERTHRWHNDAALYESLVDAFRYVSQAAEEEWLGSRLAYSMKEVSLAICVTESSQHIGNIYLKKIDWVARTAGVAMFIGEPDQRSRGYGQAALQLLMDHAFGDLGLRRLYLEVLEDNEAAIRLYEKCGFVVEGKLRQHVLKHGKLVDVLVMGLCVDDSHHAS